MKTTIATVAALVVASAAPAFAQDVSVRIDRDLLDTQAGRTAVYERFQDAARSACISEKRNRQWINQSECSSELVGSMINSLGDNRIAAIHNNAIVVAGQ